MLKITANNALILLLIVVINLFLPPSRLPLRLINLSTKVSEVLSDASKSPLEELLTLKT